MIAKNFHDHKTIYVVTLISILFTASGLRAEERLPVSKVISESTKEFLSDRGRTGSLVGSIIAGAAVANPLAPVLGSVVGFFIGKSSDFSNKDSNSARRDAYANRSLVPAEGLEVTRLAGLTGKPPQESEQEVIIGMSGKTGTENRAEQSEQIVVTGLSMRTAVGKQAEQTEPGIIADLSRETGTGNQLEPTEQAFNADLFRESGTANRTEQTEQIVIVGLSEETGTGRSMQQQLTDACSNVQPTQPLPISCYYYSQ